MGQKPTLKFIFQFGGHRTASDANFINWAVEKYSPHFYAPETPRYFSPIPTDLVNIQKPIFRLPVRQKRLGLKEIKKMMAELEKLEKEDQKLPEFAHKQGDLLEQVKTPVITLELHPRWQSAYLNFLHRVEKPIGTVSRSLFWHGRLKSALLAERAANTITHLELPIRDDNMIKNSGKLLNKILAAYPDMAAEKEIRILVRLGSAHRPVAWGARKSGLSTVVVFDRPPIFPHETKQRFLQFMKRPNKLTDEQLAQDILMDAIASVLPDRDNIPTDKIVSLSHVWASRFSLGEIRALTNRIRKARDKDTAWDSELERMLESKGIKLPKNREQFDDSFSEHVGKRFGRSWKEPFEFKAL